MRYRSKNGKSYWRFNQKVVVVNGEKKSQFLVGTEIRYGRLDRGYISIFCGKDDLKDKKTLSVVDLYLHIPNDYNQFLISSI